MDELDRLNQYCVYRHVSPSEKVYIGITRIKPQYRWGNNGNGYLNNPYFSNAIKKYGWDNFKHEILFLGLTREEAYLKEIEFIRLSHSTDKRFGYNISGGGEGSNFFTEETRRKISIGNKGKKRSEEFKRNLSMRNTGKPFSESRKRNISISLMGKKLSDEHRKTLSRSHVGLPSGNRKKVGQFTLDNVFIREFESASDAAMELHCNNSSISGVCCGDRKTCKGYKWKYSDGKGGWLSVEYNRQT